MRGSVAKAFRRKAEEEASYFGPGKARRYGVTKTITLRLMPNCQREIYKKLKREFNSRGKPPTWGE